MSEKITDIGPELHNIFVGRCFDNACRALKSDFAVSRLQKASGKMGTGFSLPHL
ncbi:predicted protein [Sclerotinia sclerotiorum 1980 UF-70]|uniref:Uncharacterized protein n=1 Tax=Sclerotinia sclerotiorum (strain ATCC 18683 / 1980 / Ss-1) TaxID=665079 RepID=A7F6U1_SCLS1|nr:predicted protein [Sclerotinia sclerotiorum 1980 UF-70]EDN98462.1 predicted protein [Sclerotinia sclerotiorum 1980 UF-70]